MSARDTILTAFVQWFKAVNTLTDAQVKRERHGGAKRALPFVEIGLAVHNVPRSMTENRTVYVDPNDPPNSEIEHREYGMFQGTLTITGFGDGSIEWMECANVNLKRKRPDYLASPRKILDDAGLTVRPIGGINDASVLLTTAIEPQYTQDYQISYGLESGAAVIPHVDTVETTVEIDSPSQGDTTTFVISESVDG